MYTDIKDKILLVEDTLDFTEQQLKDMWTEAQIDFKLTKQSSAIRMFPTSNFSPSSGAILVVFHTMPLGSLVNY